MRREEKVKIKNKERSRHKKMREEEKKIEPHFLMKDQKVSFITFETFPSKHCSYSS
jgi:hypothetical protein